MKKVFILALAAFCSCAGQTIGEYNLTTRSSIVEIKQYTNTDSIVNSTVFLNKESAYFNEADKVLKVNGRTFTVTKSVTHQKWQNQNLFFDSSERLIEQHEVSQYGQEKTRFSSYSFYDNKIHYYEVQVIVSYNEESKRTAKTIIIDNVSNYKSKTYKL